MAAKPVHNAAALFYVFGEPWGRAMTLDDIDATGLIREAYRIEGISAAECRSIFVDWAIKLPGSIQPQEAIERLLAAYGDRDPDHPMSAVLRGGLDTPPAAARRGGRRGRLGSV